MHLQIVFFGNVLCQNRKWCYDEEMAEQLVGRMVGGWMEKVPHIDTGNNSKSASKFSFICDHDFRSVGLSLALFAHEILMRHLRALASPTGWKGRKSSVAGMKYVAGDTNCHRCNVAVYALYRTSVSYKD